MLKLQVLITMCFFAISLNGYAADKDKLVARFDAGVPDELPRGHQNHDATHQRQHCGIWM